MAGGERMTAEQARIQFLEKENAELKRQLEEQRFMVTALMEQICHAVNSVYVSFGQKPCHDWLEHAAENWPQAFKKPCGVECLNKQRRRGP